METLTLQQQIDDGKNVKHSPNRVRFESGSSERGKRRSRRSDSGEPTFMSPLSFEEVDVKNTPLSSMRSCSEYQRQQLEVQANTALNARTSTKSWWSSLFGLSPEPESPVKRASCSFSYINNDKTNSKMKLRRDSIEETMFLVEKLRFNPANLYEGEDYRFPDDIDDEGSTFGQGTCFSINIGGGGGSESSNLYYHSRKHKNTGSIFGESSAAFDYIFGVKLGSDPIPMEIELKCFSSSKIYYNSPDQGEEGIDIEHERLSMECPLRLSLDPNRLSNVSSTEMLAPSAPSTPGSIRRNASWRNLENGTAYNDATDNMTGGTSIEIRFEIDRVTQSLMMRAMMQGYWDAVIAFLKQRFPNSRGQEEFYESIRLQPFASGAYLRCMLLAGLSSTVFEIYNLAVWPVQEEQVALSPNLHALEMFLYINLLVQIFLNIVQLPFRLRIHFLCWESSRAVEVDAAITIIRNMLQSESWLVNKALGKILDGLMLFNLLITEAYLWCSSKTDPLRGLMISLAATNMLTIVARVLVATVFSFSMHDPHVLSEARRRGLSKWDLDVLPTFVYSKPEEVNNGDCPICLCGFEMGEMLISLPCDAKHSFHAACIRQWLQRQNSCPLCQRLV